MKLKNTKAGREIELHIDIIKQLLDGAPKVEWDLEALWKNINSRAKEIVRLSKGVSHVGN